MFSQVSGVGAGVLGRGKARSQGVSEGQEVAASAVPWRSHGAVGASGGVLGGLRNGEMSGREALWRSRFGPRRRLTGGAERRLGSGCVSVARMAVEGVPYLAICGGARAENRGFSESYGASYVAPYGQSYGASSTRSYVFGVPRGRAAKQTDVRTRLGGHVGAPVRRRRGLS